MRKAKKTSLYVLAVACALCLGLALSACGGKEAEPAHGFGEEGTYYCSVSESEDYILTLRDGTYMLDLGSGVSSGTYVYDGGALAFSGDDALTEGTAADGTVRITYGGVSYTFLRYEYYTVTFRDGTDAIFTLSVLNGRAVEDPGEAGKDGYVFLGWYADAALTVRYGFGTAVTADTDVYARYEARSSAAEYVVTYDLGDGETYAEETLNGRIYELPEPERAGWTFLGWWVSATEDADELTYRYGGEALEQDTTLFAVWAEEGASYLGASATGDGVTWMNAVGSTTEITVTDADGETVEERGVQSSAYSSDVGLGSLPAGKYTVTVASGGVEETLTYVARGLKRVSGYQVVSGSILMYEPVEDAEGYYVAVECGNGNHDHGLLDNGTSLYYDFSACEMGPDGITFTVYAYADGYYRSVSSYNYFLGLGTVELRADGNSVSWDRVENAMEYEVYVYGTLVATVSDTSYSMSEYGTGIWEVTVRPVTTGYWSEESELFLFEKTTLASPTISGVGNHTVSWTEVEDATGYIVSINGKESAVSGGSVTSLILSDDNYDEGLDSYEIAVKATAADSANDSPYGESVIVTGTSVGSAVSYENGTVTWQYSLSASEYRITVNDGDETVVTGTNSSPVTLTKSGNNEIRIYFVNDYNEIYGTASVTVYAYAVVFDARGGTAYLDGEAVDTIYVAKGDTVTLPTAEHDTYVADFHGWYTLPDLTDDPDAVAYGGDGTLFEDGTVFTGSSTMVLYACWLNRRLDVALDMGIGVSYDEDGNLVSDALIPVNSSTYVLPVPEPTDAAYAFMGWYSRPDGAGLRFTYEDGSAYRIFNDVSVTTLYAYWAEVLSFSTTTYDSATVLSVAKGSDIGLVSEVTIPEAYTYNGTEYAVQHMSATAFNSCSSLEVINIPDTIIYMSVSNNGYSSGNGTFASSANIREVNVYATGEPSTTKEVTYYSEDGVLFWNNTTTGATEILYYPYGREDESYRIPETVSNENEYELQGLAEVPVTHTVTSIPVSCFRLNAHLRYVTIPSTIEEIGNYAFYGATALEYAEIEEGIKEIPGYMFQSCTALREVYLPDGLESIGTYAFSGCTAMTSLTVPDSVTEIGTYMCNGCTSLTHVELSANCTYVNDRDFYNCSSLTGIEIPWGVTAINQYAFYGCSSLLVCDIPYSVDTIGTYAFYNCSSLRTMDVPDSVTSLGTYCFYGCSSATSAHIPTGISEVPNYAFYNCYSLKEIYIPDNITRIGNYAFYYCYSLTQITIPASVTEIGSSAFRYCYKLVEIYDMSDLGITVTTGSTNGYIGSNAKNVYTPTSGESWLTDDEDGFRFIKDSDGEYYLMGYYGTETDIVLPDGIDGGYAIYDYAFYYDRSLTGVTIPSCVTAIGARAFYNCTSLTSFRLEADLDDFSSNNYLLAYAGQDGDGITVYIGAGVTRVPAYMFYPYSTASYSPKVVEVVFDEGSACESVGAYAFYNCSSLVSVNLPDGLKTIENYAFYNCSSLVSVSLPDGLEEIGGYAFQNCSSLESVDIPGSVAELSQYAFAGCSALTAVTAGAGLVTVARNAFYNCTELSSVILPSGIEYIGTDAFTGTALITDKTLWYGELLYIGEYLIRCDTGHEGETSVRDGTSLVASGAFYGCTAVTRVTLPESVLYMGDQVFYNCNALEYVNIPKQVTTIGEYLFYNCYVLDGVEVPACVTEIGQYAFYNCNSLTSLPLPGTVTTIGQYAFYNCSSLVRMEIPDAVERLENYTFYGCSSLRVVVIPDTMTYVGQRCFYNCSSLETVYLGEGLTSIGNYAFYNCGAVTDLYFCCTELGNLSNSNYVFYCVGQDSTGMTVRVSANVTQIPDYLFYPYSNLTYSPTITSVVFEEGSVCTTIGDHAFRGCSSMTSINLPDTLTSIGQYAFYSCYGLITITVPAGVASIGSYAFQNDYKLVEIYNESSLEITAGSGSALGYIGDNAFNVYTPTEGESHLTNDNGYIFAYDPDGNYYLMGYDGGSADLVLPDLVDGNAYEIYMYAFYERPDIASVTIPDTVTAMGENAFRYMNSLESVTMGSGITYVPEYQFYQDGALETVVFSDNITEIGDYAFADCSSLKNFTLPAELVTIGADAFYRCTSMTNVVIPSKVGTIDGYAFYGCSALTSVTMGDSVAYLGSYSFYNCSALASFRFSEGLEYIGQYAMYGCSVLSEVTIPENVTTIGTHAFDGCKGLTAVYFDAVAAPDLSNSNYVFAYAGQDVDETVIYVGAKVTKIPAYMFYPYSSSSYHAEFTSVVFAEGSVCGSIGNYAFYESNYLTSINIPDTVTSIGNYAFNSCNELVDVNIPKSLTSLGSYAFYDCNLVKSFDLPDTLTSIGSYAFSYCTSLSTITIPDGVTSISDHTFYQCPSLMQATIGSGVRSIGTSAFQYCYKLVEIYNRSSLSISASSSSYGYVGYYALNVYKTSGESRLSADGDGYVFYHDTDGTYYLAGYAGEETDLVFPASVDGQTYRIYKYAFYGREDITSVRLGDGVTAVGEYAFYQCYGIQSLTMGGGVTEIERYAFYTLNNMKTLEIGENVETIGEYAFYWCSQLTEIIIPDSVKTIAGNAFNHCSAATSLTIGKGVESIANYAFYNETGLEDIYYNAVLVNDLAQSNYVFYKAGQDGNGITVHIGEDVTYVPAYIFYPYNSTSYIPYVTAVVFDQDSACKTIGNYAFYYCNSLEYVVLSAGVTSIEANAFGNCTSLTAVYYYGSSSSYRLIAVDDNNTCFDEATAYYYSASRRYGGYWRFDDDGVPAVW